MREFTGEYAIIPELTQSALTRYVENHIAPGGFLTAVLCNDLFGAMGKADLQNLDALTAIVRYIYNHTPGNCWGSKDIIDEWLKRR